MPRNGARGTQRSAVLPTARLEKEATRAKEANDFKVRRAWRARGHEDALQQQRRAGQQAARSGLDFFVRKQLTKKIPYIKNSEKRDSCFRDGEVPAKSDVVG